MRLTVYQPPDTRVLWRMTTFGQQVVPAGRWYWWDNARRDPPDLGVIQASLRGRVLFRDANGDQIVEPGSIILFMHGEATAYGQPNPLTETYRCQWVGVQGAGLPEHFRALRQRHGGVIHTGLDHPLLRDLADLIAMAEPQAATPTTRQAAAIHGLLMRLYEHAESGRQQSLSPVEQAVEHVLRQPFIPLSLEQIAARFGCSREHLSRTFQQRVGQSPGIYLASARREQALRLLRETDLPLAAVAEQAGFASVHTLARQVRSHAGVSPSRLRAGRRRSRIGAA
jgi:AraC-like DNA-binding protein